MPTQLRSSTYVHATIDAARQGSLRELETLHRDLKKLPEEALPDILDVFLSHLQSSRIPSNEDPLAARKAHLLALTSITGLHAIASLASYRAKYAKQLLETMVDDFDYVLLLWKKISRGRDEESMTLFKSQMFPILFSIETAGDKNLLKLYERPEFQTLVCSFWLHDSVEGRITLPPSVLLIRCLAYPSSLGRLIEMAGGPNPVNELVERAILRLETAMKKPFKGRTSWDDLSAECLNLQSFVEKPGHKLALAVLKHGALGLILKVLRSCAKVIPNDREGLDLHHRLEVTTASCLVFISSSLNIKPGMVRKVLRGDFIQILFSLMPWYASLMDVEARLHMAMRHVFVEYLPRDLVSIKSIDQMSSIVRTITPEARESMMNSTLAKDWQEMEKMLIERFVIRRVTTLIRRTSYCKACRKRMQKTALLKCTGCRQAFYCTKECQKIDWKSGHKLLCLEYSSRVVSRIKRRLAKVERKTTCIDTITQLYVCRHLQDAAKNCIGSIEKLDPKSHIFIISHGGIFTDVAIMELTEFISRYLSDAPEQASIYRGIARNVEKGNVICANFYHRGPERDLTSLTVSIESSMVGKNWKNLDNKIGRPVVNIVDKPDVISVPEADIVDFLLASCGNNANEFWTMNLDPYCEFMINGLISLERTRPT